LLLTGRNVAASVLQQYVLGSLSFKNDDEEQS
jgi:hypothetical protein